MEIKSILGLVFLILSGYLNASQSVLQISIPNNGWLSSIHISTNPKSLHLNFTSEKLRDEYVGMVSGQFCCNLRKQSEIIVPLDCIRDNEFDTMSLFVGDLVGMSAEEYSFLEEKVRELLPTKEQRALARSTKVKKLQSLYKKGEAIEWIKVHELQDYDPREPMYGRYSQLGFSCD